MSEPFISLCLIAGNEEMHVRRCLKTFAPMADEIIVVRAIGSKKPDATLEIAAKEFGAKTGEYFNAPENAAWPHVDSFAAARNQAFGMATGRFQIWVDFDDIAEANHVLALREVCNAADEQGWDIVHLPYSIPYSGATPRRERIVRRGCGHWVNAVHECITNSKEGVKHVEAQEPVIIHAPLTNKVKNGESNSRNLRILESIKQRNVSELFYYHMELIGLGRNAEAIAAAKDALTCKEMGPHERYEILTNLARISETENQREQFLLEAVRTDPERREALSLLAVEAVNRLQPLKGLAYARMMRALPKPNRNIYSLRRAVYGFLGDSIYAMALRANGQKAEADALELYNFKQAKGKITLLHATRGRGGKAQFTRKYWFDTALNPEQIEHIFCFDEDDTESRVHLDFFNHVMVPPGGGCVAAWNAAARAAHGEVFITMADDVVPGIGWDKAILDRIGDTSKPAVLATSDGYRTDALLTLAILTRARYDQQGRNVWHPRFKSMFCDNYFTRQAYKDGVVIEARDIVFEHQHPVFQKANFDQTYAVSNSTRRYQEGREIYMDLTGETLPEIKPMAETWMALEGWFDFGDIYDAAVETAPDGAKLVEVGVAYGKSAAYMATKLKEVSDKKPEAGGKTLNFYAVDNFEGSPGESVTYSKDMHWKCLQNLEMVGAAPYVQLHQADSATFAKNFRDGELHFVFIDADHTYEGCKRDIAAWWPKVAPGGFIAGHDYANSEGVRRAVKEAFPKFECVRACWRVQKAAA